MIVTFHKTRWNSAHSEPMSESMIRSLYAAPEKVRISRYTYDAGATIEGRSRSCTCYVLDGTFTFAYEKESASLETGDVFAFSGGNYLIRIGESSEAVVVWVWDLPAGFG